VSEDEVGAHRSPTSWMHKVMARVMGADADKGPIVGLDINGKPVRLELPKPQEDGWLSADMLVERDSDRLWTRLYQNRLETTAEARGLGYPRRPSNHSFGTAVDIDLSGKSNMAAGVGGTGLNYHEMIKLLSDMRIMDADALKGAVEDVMGTQAPTSDEQRVQAARRARQEARERPQTRPVGLPKALPPGEAL
jgi:hypothetical protein